MTFTHLQVQSGFTLMDSTIKIDQLVAQAKQLGYTSIALTDMDVMSGAVAFYKACKHYDIKPIIGMKVKIDYEDGSFTSILLAENNQGYQNLLKISSLLQTQKKSMVLHEIQKYVEGLICIVITSQSKWADTLLQDNGMGIDEEYKEWQGVFGKEHLFLSIQDVDLHKERQLHKPLKRWSEKNGVPVVAIGDVKYLHKEDVAAYQCLKAINEGNRLSNNTQNQSSHQYLKPPQEMETFFKDWWFEVLEATGSIVNRCKVEIDLNQQLLPTFPVPAGKSSSHYLSELCYDALEKTYKADKERAVTRVEHELNVITSMNFSDYFLIVWDFVSYARGRGIHAGPGRGSAAGSLVAYLLNITQVDPLEYNLLFERFLNPERITMPDIDIDFPDHRRDEVIEYVAEKYGKQHVAQICTFGTFAARSVLREVFKALAVDEHDASFILNQIPKGKNEKLTQIVKSSESLKTYIRNSEQLKHVFYIADKLEGLPRHVSTHAAGVIISERPLINYTPLMNGQGETYLTQFAMGDLESIGLLKIDFLGLRNLTFIENVEGKIKKFKDPSFSIDTIPLNDQKTFELLKSGRTNGVFQLESQGMKNVLEKVEPSDFEDIVAVNALYRPGPMEFIPLYTKRKHGKEKIEYPHPDIQSVLEPTFGVLVYQEQIMQVARKIAGYSLGEADLLRRAVSKKQQGVLEEQREEFIRKSMANGYEKKVSDQLFDWIVKFSNYGFNRSHAVAYSLISYRLAFMKAHYPTYFLVELINSNLGEREKVSVYIREAKELGLRVQGPSINRSTISTRDEYGDIRMGLLAVKGVGFQAAQMIQKQRKNSPYRSLNDFCLRLVSKVITRQVIESLIISGAFDEIDLNRASLLASIDQALEQGELFKEFQDQPELFGEEFQNGEALIEVEPFPVLKKLAMEKEVLGTYLSEHPLQSHRQSLRREGVVTIQQALNSMSKKASVVAVLDTVKEIRTKRGEPMAFIVTSDEAGELDGVLFPEVYRSARPWLAEQALVRMQGNLDERRGKKQLLITEIKPFEGTAKVSESPQRLFIKVSESQEMDAIVKLKEISNHFPGNTPVLIFRAEDRKTYKLENHYGLEISRECLKQLYDFFGRESVALRSRQQ